MSTLAVGRVLAELTQLPYASSLADITRAMRSADEIVIRSVAGAFDVACPSREAKDLRGEFLENFSACVRDV